MFLVVSPDGLRLAALCWQTLCRRGCIKLLLLWLAEQLPALGVLLLLLLLLRFGKPTAACRRF
jgi:hypothetical protein